MTLPRLRSLSFDVNQHLIRTALGTTHMRRRTITVKNEEWRLNTRMQPRLAHVSCAQNWPVRHIVLPAPWFSFTRSVSAAHAYVRRERQPHWNETTAVCEHAAATIACQRLVWCRSLLEADHCNFLSSSLFHSIGDRSAQVAILDKTKSET